MLAALPHLEKFRADNPGLDLRLEANNSPVDFERDNVNAAVQLGEPPFNGLAFHRLFKSRVAPCADQKLLERFEPIRSSHDLAKMPLIKFNTAPDSWQRWFSEMEPELASREPDLISDSLLTGMQMARSGMGVILAPFPLASPMVTSGALSVVKLWGSLQIGLRDFYFTYRKVDASSEKIKAVHKWLKVIARDLEAEAATLGI
jgi:LysR family glycine cleavage system transcriptional activator